VRRSRIQWAFLAVVLAVSVLASTLLATLYLLAAATETTAARAALKNATAEQTQFDVRMDVEDTVAGVITGADGAATELFGDIPYTRTVTVQGSLLALAREDRSGALAYLGFTDAMDDRVTVRSGQLPQPTSTGPVEVLVPPALLHDLDIEIGDEFGLANYADRKDRADFKVVGTYTVNDPDDPVWLLDRLGGSAHRPDVVVPFTGGMVTTDGFGPIYTAIEEIETLPVDTVMLSYTPDFSATSLTEVNEVLSRLESFERILTRSVGDAGSGTEVVTSVGDTLGGVVGSLAVTRSSVLVTGLLLLVLAVAALSQTARLMAERRYAEQHLMIARGSSGRQLFRLGLIEAVALGIITAAAAAPLARLVFLALATTPVMVDAGMDIDPGIPTFTWAVTAVVGVILIIVLVAPLARRQTSFVDAEQARSRPGRRAAFQRSGLDVAVLALAGLAYWQLKNYKSPVLSGDDVASVDPLLAAGPALALLAGALVAVRLIPPASKVLEAVAARGRKAVLPLAAWEVGRRSARAVSAILLLTLAVSIGTFSLTFLTTWHQSQQDQAHFQHPQDAVVTDIEGTALGQRSQVDDGTYATTASGVVREVAVFGATPDYGEVQGRAMTLLATDTEGLKTYGVGRLDEIAGYRVSAALGGKAPEEVNPIPIPGTPQQLSMNVTAEASQNMGDVRLLLRAVIRSEAGDYQTIPLGQVALNGEEHHLIGTIGTTSDLATIQSPLYLVGLQGMWISFNEGPPEGIDDTRPLALTVSIDDITAETPVLAIPVRGVPSVVDATPLEIPASLGWTATNRGVGVDTLAPEGDQIHMRVIASVTALLRNPASLVLTAAERSLPLPIVANGAAVDATSIDVGEEGVVQIGNTQVPVYVAERVPMLSGSLMGRQALVANVQQLQIANIQSGGDALSPQEWWIGLDDADIDAYTATLPEGAHISTKAQLAHDLTNDPLRVAIQAALWLVTGAAVVLAALGFAVHAIVTVRAREIELAQMRAIGVLRGQLLRIVSSENGFLSLLGLVFGLGLGIALSYLVAPLVSVGADGRPPLPHVIIDVPWNALGLLVAEVALVLIVSIFIVSIMLRRIKPAQMLRLGDER